MFEKSWVWIPVLDTSWLICDILELQDHCCKPKRAGDGPLIKLNAEWKLKFKAANVL